MKTDKIFSFWKRLLQVLLQIALLPLSALFSVLGGWVFWFNATILVIGIIEGEFDASYFLMNLITSAMASCITVPIATALLIPIESLKKKSYFIDAEEGTTYTYQAEVSHDIYNKYGDVVGTYKTTETKEGYNLSSGEKKNVKKFILLSIVALPCRIISLIASIVACFTDKFFVSIKPVVGIGEYNRFLHTYFDIIKLKDKETQKNEIKNSKSDVFTNTALLIMISLFFILWSVRMITDPLLAFEHLHFGWVIAIYTVAFIVSMILVFCVLDYLHQRIILIVSTVVCLVLMIVGMATTDAKTITISSAQEFDLILNLPKASSCHYVLTSDIDFEGKSSKAYGSIEKFTGILDGNGHYIKNMNISKPETNVVSESSSINMGLVLYNCGEIKNLGFKNCTIEAFVSSHAVNTFGIIAGKNEGVIDNCTFVDTYAKCYHRHLYGMFGIIKCEDAFGYVVGANNSMKDVYTTSEDVGEVTNIKIYFETENKEFLSKYSHTEFEEREIYVINDFSSSENMSVVDRIGFLNNP